MAVGRKEGTGVPQGCTGFYRVLQGSINFHRLLRGSTELWTLAVSKCLAEASSKSRPMQPPARLPRRGALVQFRDVERLRVSWVDISAQFSIAFTDSIVCWPRSSGLWARAGVAEGTRTLKVKFARLKGPQVEGICGTQSDFRMEISTVGRFVFQRLASSIIARLAWACLRFVGSTVASITSTRRAETPYVP